MRTWNYKRMFLGMLASIPFGLALVVGLRTPAAATVSTTNLAVSANVVAACTGLSAQPLNFPNYDGSTFVNGSADVTFTCSNGVLWNLDADNGQHFAGTRRMEFAMLMSSLGYQLFTDNTFAAQWGSGITGGATLGGSGTGSLVTRTIAGRINVGELAPAGGPYTDSVLVTLTF